MILDFPGWYWDARDHTEFWQEYFAAFDAMNLGTIPARPLERGVPEPATRIAIVIAMVTVNRRRQS